MIAHLRRRHRLTFFALTPALVLLVALALTGRPEMPSGVLPEPLAGATAGDGVSAPAGFANTAAQISRSAGVLSLTLTEPLRAPDVLAYYSRQAAAAGDALPGDVRLLGPVSHGRVNAFELPDEATGHLLLYSLGHQTLVDAAPLTAVGGAR